MYICTLNHLVNLLFNVIFWETYFGIDLTLAGDLAILLPVSWCILHNSCPAVDLFMMHSFLFMIIGFTKFYLYFHYTAFKTFHTDLLACLSLRFCYIIQLGSLVISDANKYTNTYVGPHTHAHAHTRAHTHIMGRCTANLAIY